MTPDSRRTLSLAVVAFALVVAPAGAATVAAQGVDDGDARTGPAQVTDGPGGACDYQSLYDETIDSVVAVRSSAGLGSGFVFDPNVSPGGNETNGDATYVVTNAHVVGEEGPVEVQFSDETTATGTVVGQDESTDLAVIRVTDAPAAAEPLALADPPAQHGQPVAALGNPFGFDETITHGIVSGTNRSLPTRTGFRIPNTIQTDAPISPGNSGGPLVNCDGEVVGVNTAGIAARGAENLGFAISASVVDRVVPALIANGTFEHPFLGVGVTEVTPAVAAANDLETTRGVLVTSVVNETPAAAVLRESDDVAVVRGTRVPVGGDVILSVEGAPVTTGEDLASVLLTETRPGEEVTLTVLRDGERVTVTPTLVERPEPGTT